MNRETSNKKVLDEKDRKLFVVSLPHDITTDDLREHFQQFGAIEDVRIIKNKEVGTLRGFGFILFYDRVSCIRVFEQGDHHVIRGKPVDKALL
jgi:RNA recognition motif-containing protein